jgi:hypothetical protein
MAGDLIRHSDTTVQCGPLYHALHGLVLYRERTRPTTAATTAAPAAVSVAPTTDDK